MRIAVLTGGGVAPGVNSAIHRLAILSELHGHTLYGIRGGWRGLHDGYFMPLSSGMLNPWAPGTVLGTSRWNPRGSMVAMIRIIHRLDDKKMDGLIAIGGNDTLATALALHEEYSNGIPIVGIPKTIDNDLPGCDTSIGFSTAVAVIKRAVADIGAVARSMERTYIIEVMGRRTGWLAAHGGEDASQVALPEVPCTPDHFLTGGGVIVISEGAHIHNGDMDLPVALDSYGNELLYQRHLADRLANEFGARGANVRTLVLGHLQNGALPVEDDMELGRVYATEALVCLEDGLTLIVPAYFAGELRRQPLKTMAGQQREMPRKTIADLVDTGVRVAGWEED